jgi:cyclic pyranopterin phosphate synthase
MLSRLRGLDDLTLTTNGSLLCGQAQALREAGLSRITVSLDALDQPTFARTSGGRGEVDEVLRGIEAAERAGLWPIKVNCVVQRGVNEHAVLSLVRHFVGRAVEVRFIEFMDVGTLNGWRSQAVVTADEIRSQLETLGPLVPLARRHTSEVAERYAYADGSGQVGIIASVTRPFCGGCTRARLSAEGSLLSCLFAEAGLDLRAPLRGGEDDPALARRMVAFWQGRRDRYSEERAAWQGTARVRRRLEMYQVGG